MKRLYVTLALILAWFSSGVATAATALIVGGNGGYATLTDQQMREAFGGYFADYTRVAVTLPATDDFGQDVADATDELYMLVYNTPGQKTIGAVSEGGPVLWETLRRLDSDLADNNANTPSPEELDAVVYGDPSRHWFLWGSSVRGYTYRPPPETPYHVTVVMAEYDGVADFPDNWFNLLAVVNAIMGADQLHVSAAFSGELKPEYIITETTNSKGGTTTVYLIPTPVLPLLQPWADNGVGPAFISALDGFLRPIIDSAYVRPSSREAAAPFSTLASNEPPDPKATTLRLSGSTPADPGTTKIGFDAATQAQQELDTAAKGAANATAGHTQTTTEATDRLGAARDATTTGRPAGATDLTDGNQFKPGQVGTEKRTDHDTDVRADEQEEGPTRTRDADDGPTNAADKDSDPSAGDANAGASSDGDE